MYRLLVLTIAVVVLGTVAFWSGFLFSNQSVQKRTDNIAAIIADTEKALPVADGQDAVEGDGGFARNLDALKLNQPLTPEEVNDAVQKAGQDAEKTALRVGQNAEQAALARKMAEDAVRIHMERRLKAERAAAKAP